MPYFIWVILNFIFFIVTTHSDDHSEDQVEDKEKEQVADEPEEEARSFLQKKNW